MGKINKRQRKKDEKMKKKINGRDCARVKK